MNSGDVVPPRTEPQLVEMDSVQKTKDVVNEKDYVEIDIDIPLTSGHNYVESVDRHGPRGRATLPLGGAVAPANKKKKKSTILYRNFNWAPQ